MGKFVIKTSEKGASFNLKASNGQVVATSQQYASLGTAYYKRIFSCLSPLIMMIIACSMNYRFRKNVLFMSLVCSIAVAVVYFVVQMMTEMMADQGVIAPYYGSLVPFAVILLLSAIIGLVFRRG